MNKKILNSCVSVLALAGFLNITAPLMAMEEEEDIRNTLRSMSLSSSRVEDENSPSKQIQALIERGEVDQALHMVTTEFPEDATVWEGGCIGLVNLPLETLETISPASIRSFREAFQLALNTSNDHSHYSLQQISKFLVVEAFLHSLQTEGCEEGLTRAHQVFRGHEEDIINEHYALPAALEKISVEQFYKLFSPLLERMVSSGKYNNGIMTDFMFRIFKLPYDDNKSWYDQAASLLAGVPKTKKDNENDYAAFTSRDASLYKLMLAFYTGEAESTIRTMLFEDALAEGDASVIDVEDLPLYIRALAYKGADKLGPETRAFLQMSILEGYESDDCDSDEARDILAFEDTLHGIFAGADEKKTKKLGKMLKEFREEASKEEESN